MKTTLKAIGLASVLALSSLSAQAQTTLKFAHPTPESDLQHTLAEFFKKDVEKRSKGELKIDIFPNGQLGTDQQMIDGVRSGIIDIEMSGLNNFTGLLPEAAAFTLPFMFPDRDTAYKVLDGEVGQSVAKKMEEHGLKNLGYPENGYRNISNNRGPVRVPADLDGLRMRVNNSVALNDMFALLGANPQQIQVAELYTALETGVVDAQDHPIGVVLSFKFYEVQDYLSLSQHAYAALNLVMNLEKFNSLPPEQQTIITEAAKAATDMQRELSIEKEEEMLAELEANGMEINRDVDAAAFQEAVKPVWDNFVKENGNELIDQIQAASK